MNFEPLDIRRYFETRMPDMSRRINGHAEVKVLCPFHDDRNPSLSLNFEKGLWNCHAGCGGGGLLAFEEKFSSCDRDAARANVAEILGKKIYPFTKPEATYEYHDVRGRLIFRKLRFPGKKFVLQQPVGKGWLNNLEGITKKPLYKLPEVITSNAVVICEGEKDVDRICSLNLSELHPGTRVAATTNYEGAGPQKWRGEYSLYFGGKDVVILPDNDDVGRARAEEIADDISKYANGVKIVTLPGLDQHQDVSDYLDSHSREELIAHIASTPGWTSKLATTSDDGLICLADVEPRAVRWLWEGRIPMGTVTVTDGDPGLGKSTLTLDIGARVTTCTSMPDGTPVGATGGVIFLSSEDALANTIRPRLDEAGADCSKVFAFNPDTDIAPLTFPADIARLEAMIVAHDVKLVIVDPLVAYLGEDINSHRDQDVRRAMAPLQRMAERTNVAIIGIRHLNKTPGGSAIYRGGGSIAIIGAARAGFLVALDPDDPETRVFAATKSNLARLPCSLQFRVVEVTKEAVNGEKITISKIAWRGTSDRSASELLAQPTSEEDRSAVDDAVEILQEVLADGPRSAKKVQAEAKTRGVSWATIRRAKKKAGVESKKSEYQGEWMLALQRCSNHPKDAHPKTMSTFGQNEHLWTDETEEGSGWWPS